MTIAILLMAFIIYAIWNESRIDELQKEQELMKSHLRIMESQIQRLNIMQGK